jgi:hypothetical protein
MAPSSLAGVVNGHVRVTGRDAPSHSVLTLAI